MRPTAGRGEFGWDGPARVGLILSAAALGLLLVWASSDQSPGEVATPSLSVDANSAPNPVLGALPGLGPVLAARIIATREARPFDSIEDFDRRVPGIGPSKVAALRPYLRFDPIP